MATATTQTTDQASSLRLPRGRALEWRSRPLVMGVLNLTPDSFSDGGQFPDADSAVERGLEMLAEGADLLDLGAESTRPGGGVYGAGAATVGEGEEIGRLLPVLEKLREHTDGPLSIDTRKAAVARRALAAGGDLVNDISGLGDAEMADAVAAAGTPLVLMHSRGDLRTMQRRIRYDDLLGEVRTELEAAVEQAVERGVDRGQIVIDPGIGFGKTAAQNLELLARLDELATLGAPVLIGASRKSFIGDVTGARVDRRLAGSLAAVAWAARHRTAIVRVHDVAETVQFLEIWQAIRREGQEP